MRKGAALAALLLASVALAQATAPALNATSGVNRSEMFSSAVDSLYVDTTGNDSGACTSSGAGACLTLQAAVDKLAKYRKHAATITVGLGSTFAGAVISGFNIQPNRAGSNNALNIVCTLATAVPATGTATGTLTGFSAASGATFATMTDSNALWTTSDFVGKLVEITAGTGSGANSVYVITANTGTVLTLAGSVTTTASGATYFIRDWGTVFNTAVAAEASGPFAVSNQGAAVFKIAGNTSADGNFGTNITIQRCAVSVTANSNNGIYVESSRIASRWNKFKGTGTFFTGVNINRQGGANIQNSYFELTSSGIGVSMGNTNASAGGMLINNSFFTGGTTGLNIIAPLFIATGSLFKGHTGNALLVSNGFVGGGQLTGSRIDCAAGGGGGILVATSATTGGSPIASLGVSTTDISNCATAVSLEAAGAAVISATLTGTTNTVGVAIKKGARFQAPTTTTLTGTTEITVDAVGSDYATMRGASPKLVTNTYGTIFYE